MSSEEQCEAERKVYFVTDNAMLLHKCEWDSEHIEVPERLSTLISGLQESGLLKECEVLQSRKADLEDIGLVHEKSYIGQIASSSNMNLVEQERFSSNFEDVYVNQHSYDAALLSAGCALEAMQSVISHSDKRYKAAFAAVRPPGHHASKDVACGFCFFNNVAICAKKALKMGAERVLIVDWDVHAGQGTQYSIKDDPNILLISIHRYENGRFWPELPESAVINDYPNTVNLPLNCVGCGDSEYLSFIRHLVSPIISDFKPSLVLISCGFDAALGDSEGSMEVTPGGYQWMVHILSEEASKVGASICALLEGGYFKEAVAYSAEFCLKAMLAKPLPRLNLCRCSDEFLKTLLLAIMHYSKRFPSLELFVRIAREYRRIVDFRDLLMDDMPRDEYQGSRAVEFPYPTRGEYPRRSESAEEAFRTTLQAVVTGYSYQKFAPKVIIDFSNANSQKQSEADIHIIPLAQAEGNLAVTNFFNNFVCGHICDNCSNTVVLRNMPMSVAGEGSQDSHTCGMETTVKMICDTLSEVFALGYCVELNRLLLFDVL